MTRLRRLDVGLAVVMAVALLVEAKVFGDAGLKLVDLPLAAATGATLLLRRSRPLQSLFAAEAGAIACIAVFDASRAALATVMVALFSVARSGDRRRSLMVGAVTAVVLVATVVAIRGSAEPTGFALRLVVVLGALVVGDTVRSREALRVAAGERARLDAHAREEEGRQRIVNERVRIAQDLHDTLAHALVAINVRAGVAARLAPAQDPNAALLDIKELSATALRDLRGTLHLMREPGEAAPILPTLDLAALPALIETMRAGGLAAELRVDLAGATVPSHTAQAAYRIVQEALTNVMRHARASQTNVAIAARDDELRIDVYDDGRGAGGPGPTERVGGQGHGLRGMAERATALGGRVTAGPQTGGGWHVEAFLPLIGGSA